MSCLLSLVQVRAPRPSSHNADDSDGWDPELESAMQVNIGVDDYDESYISQSATDTSSTVIAAKEHGFYSALVQLPPDTLSQYPCELSRPATGHDITEAENFMTQVVQHKEAILRERTQRRADAREATARERVQKDGTPGPFTTDIQSEISRTREFLLRTRKNCAETWEGLRPWQKLAISLMKKHGLNERQQLAFLLLADTVGRQSETQEQLEPIRILVTGPGGTGKSRIFEAWTEFHSELHCSHEFRLTAPTGVVASDIGGCTIHSEAALCVKRDNMKADTPGGRKIRDALEERFSLLRTLVIDEIYFLGPKDISILSEYCGIAKGITEYPFGRLNIAASGDPCQLPPPNAAPLFDRELVRCYETDKLNALNSSTQYKVKGIQAWHQVNRVVVLTEIMRQKGDDVLLDILSRLRVGTCTQGDKDILDKYVLSSDSCSDETRSLTEITHWVTDPSHACPLITYTNAARDAHNYECAKAFATATKQEFLLYHSSDTRGRGNNKRMLEGIAAEAAWRVRVKDAEDLGGRVPYIPGMPVFGRW
jgi:hypothetical protein